MSIVLTVRIKGVGVEASKVLETLAQFGTLENPQVLEENDPQAIKEGDALVCAHCGYTSTEDWKVGELQYLWREYLWEGGEYSFGEIDPGEGDILHLVCPKCYKTSRLPEDC